MYKPFNMGKLKMSGLENFFQVGAMLLGKDFLKMGVRKYRWMDGMYERNYLDF